MAAAELAQLRGGDVELVGDPGIGPTLAHPGADLVQLRSQGLACHCGAGVYPTEDETPAPGPGPVWTQESPFAKVEPPLRRGSRATKPFQPRPEVRVPMLVLTRKTNQSIMIGDDIEITVLSVSGDKVRIGIEAPRDISVFRHEVLDNAGGGAAPTSGHRGRVRVICGSRRPRAAVSSAADEPGERLEHHHDDDHDGDASGRRRGR